MKITEITAEKKENKIQRLAAYCRVSSDSADQLHSFAAQLRYYSNYEKQHPEFELVGIYADEGLSGTSMKKRAEMNRLIQDCEQGKIDRVIVKSISRFARNTRDLLQTLRLLKSYGVTVFFEEQSIDTSQLNSEMFLTFPGMIAQQESESISGNMRWSYKKRMESGEFNCCAPAYGFDLINGELVVNETEAEVVRRIFDMYLHGAGKERIADALNDENVSTKHGTKKWHHTAIHYILNNERYMGDALLQKRYTTETLPYRQVPNNGEKPQYYIENSNPQIISKDTYHAAQRLQQAKTSHNTDAAENILSQRMFCPICARSYRRLYSGNNKYWVSVLKRKTECSCSAYKIYEEAVHEAFSILTYKLKANSELLIGKLIKQLEQLQKRYGTGGNRIEEIDKEIAQLSAQNHILAKLNNNGILGAAEYSEQSSTIENKIYSLRIERRKKLSESQEDEMLDELKTLKQIIEGYSPKPVFDESLFDLIVKKIEIIDNATLRFHLIGNMELTETINLKVRCKQHDKKDDAVRV